MKTDSQGVRLIEQRVRNKKRMLRAYQQMDILRRQAPAGWDSAEVIRQMRQIKSRCA